MVPGFGRGPCFLCSRVEASDLRTLYSSNMRMKYADDSYLLFGWNHIATASEEFKHIIIWARKNNLRLNPSKTKELIVFKSRIRHVLPPASPIISGTERVSSLRVLGVVISSDLGSSANRDQVLSFCASSMYSLRVLRSHALQPQMLHEVAWWGYSSILERLVKGRLVKGRLVKRTIRQRTIGQTPIQATTKKIYLRHCDTAA